MKNTNNKNKEKTLDVNFITYNIMCSCGGERTYSKKINAEIAEIYCAECQSFICKLKECSQLQ